MYGCRFHTLQLQGMLFKLWREAVFCLCDHVRWLCYTIPTYGFPLPFWCSTMQAVLSPCCRHRVWDLVLLLLPAQVHTMSYWGFSQVEYKPFRLQSSCLENRRKEGAENGPAKLPSKKSVPLNSSGSIERECPFHCVFTDTGC